ncbi:MAG: thiol:disulfide interchange protein DsbA/DsbL [Gammaproteobacteria bacterium]|nr:thiol:disulfide interchange protein DsbA/DsbL [Gammaproteobacteria bacterium]MYE53297.1 thiol:disulfide interchange protein DsbA/DsbL [Gammaproteobacteria bacterium]
MPRHRPRTTALQRTEFVRRPRENAMRRFKLLLGIAAALTACVCQAEAAFQEGVHYQRLPVPVDTADASRVEVVEVFSYACIHCYTFEPYIEAWRAKLDDDVAFRQVPAVFSPQWREFARIFYAAVQLGVLEQVHGSIFEALHERGQNLLDRSIATRFFATTAEVDGRDFEAALTSFSVEGQVQRAVAAGKAYGITGTPSLVVNGKFRIDTRMAGGSYSAMLEVADFLINAERALASEEADQ